MASFYAELRVAGRVYVVRRCSWEFTQATDARGRVIAKVRHGLIQLVLDVPDDDFLLDWAASPFKPLPGCVVFYETKGSAARETLAWEAGNCVGYREEFQHGSITEGSYVCFVTIAAPKLTMTPGGPGRYVAPAPGEHGRPEQALLNTPFVLTPSVTPTITPPLVPPPAPLLARIWAGVLRLLTGAPALTAALVLAPTNSRGDDGYKSEWDLNRLKQAPTDKDRARLDYLENEREHRTLSEAEADELASLLAVVRKVHVGGRRGLPGYYARQAEVAHLRQIVPEFREVNLAGPRGEAVGEFDGINLTEKIFIEDKSAKKLYQLNPTTGLPAQTPQQWADKHVHSSTTKRIKALAIAKYTYPQPAPPIEQIRSFRRLHFRVEDDTPEVQKAVENSVNRLRAEHPEWRFTTQYGK